MHDHSARPRWNLNGNGTHHNGSRPLHILMVSARYIPYIGGTEIHTYEVAQRLVEAGHRITVLTTDVSGKLPPVEYSQGIQVVRVPAWPAKRDYYLAPEIHRIVRSSYCDLIHCQGYHTFVAPLAMLAARQAGIPYVVSFHSGGHSSSVRNALRGVQQLLLRPLLAHAKKLIGVSAFETAYFQKRLHIPSDRFVTISNGSYLPRTESSTGTNNGTLIVSIGRLERHKGHHRTIAALPEVAKLYPDLRLRIIGSGPYGPALWRCAMRYGMAHRTTIGPIAVSERAGLAALLSAARLAILLSDYESQGIAILEALSMGIPALVTHTSGLAELANNGLVRSVPLNSSPETIASAMIQQLHHPLIVPHVDLPSWDHCATQLLHLYEEICGSDDCPQQLGQPSPVMKTVPTNGGEMIL